MAQTKPVLTEEMHNQGFNQCDDCGVIEKSEDLIWIDAEDFTPLEGEIVTEADKDKFPALCPKCYRDCVERNGGKINSGE